MKNKNLSASGGGFTLIELIIIIAIIGILGTMVYVYMGGTKKDAKDAKVIAAAESMMDAIQGLAMWNNDYTNYSNRPLSPSSWVTAESYCTYDLITDATLKANLIKSCKDIFNTNCPSATCPSALSFYMQSYGPAKGLSMIAYLPGENKYYCLGSNGKSSITNTSDCGSGSATCTGLWGDKIWTCPGCPCDTIYDNP